VEDRVRDFHEIEELLPGDQINRQAARCMDCGIPFCHAYGCPVKNRIPDWNDMVYRNQWRKALELLHATCNLPEITGRVCRHPARRRAPWRSTCRRSPSATSSCRSWSTGGRRVDPPGETGLPDGTARRRHRVRSRGLPAAQQLAAAGHEVVVFEKADRIGGLLPLRDPDFKLEKWVIDRRLEQMREEGVVFETGVNAGVDVSAGYLRRTFDAIVLTTGATVRGPPVPGRDLGGIHFAMDFLTLQNKANAGDAIPEGERITAAGKHVVVVGGGDTGSDCIGTSRRQGASSITQIELLPRPPEIRDPRNPWPTWPVVLRTSSSQEEGCERLWSIQTKAFAGNGDGSGSSPA